MKVDPATADTAGISAPVSAVGSTVASAVNADRAIPARELSIVVPTFNESANVGELTRRLSEALRGIAWELVFVDDDSPDRTAESVRRLAEQDARVRVIQRIGRRGLSSACVEGVLATSAPFVAVIYADLQHDERLLPAMLQTLRQGGLEIAIGSRYRDQRLRGARLLRGLASFMLVCSVGAVANVGVAQFLFSHEQGWVPAALIGIVVAAVWNFATSSFYTWGRRSG